MASMLTTLSAATQPPLVLTVPFTDHCRRLTYPMLRAAMGWMQRLPLIGAVPEYALGILGYLNSTHFYNSNSS